ncbi:MAG: hypothetical protein ACKPKO_34370, partial [Candidatus Fonsibacter sp.]
MAAGMAVHRNLFFVWERRKHQWRREMTFRASLSNATVKMIDNGVVPSKPDQPWISAKKNEGV